MAASKTAGCAEHTAYVPTRSPRRFREKIPRSRSILFAPSLPSLVIQVRQYNALVLFIFFFYFLLAIHWIQLMQKFDVTIAGELNLDLILYGLPDELPPERELLCNDMALTLGSSSAIVAHNLAALGAKVGFTSCIGQDDFGTIALERLRAMGVDVSTVVRIDPPAKTGLTVILPRAKWRNMITYSGTIAMLAQRHLDFEFLSSSRHFHLSSYFLQTGLQPYVPELLRRLKAAGLTISLDTNDDPLDKWESGIERVLPLVDVFLPNEREAQKITRTSDLGGALDKLSRLVPLVVVKLGSEGSLAIQGSERLRSKPLQVECIDPVGAGDSFDAGFLSAFVQGADLPECLASGNLAGALSVTRPGGTEAFRDRQHREQFLTRHRTKHPGRTS
jgi:sugar/nucleoside kinase (ribokinase family)